MGRLDELDLSLKLSKEEEAERLAAGWKRLEALRLALGAKLPGYGLGPPVCVLFEGWDASGKGGAIKRLWRRSTCATCGWRSSPRRRPDEKRHHYLWRFWPNLPGWGGMAVFDRSWYGRVTGRARRGLRDPGAVEARLRRDRRAGAHAAAEGMVVIKFFMHLSEDEQLKRFEERRDDPLKSWKLTPDDWENRRKRAAVRRGDRGDARSAPTTRPRRGTCRGREQAATRA